MLKYNTEGLFTCTVAVPVSVTVVGPQFTIVPMVMEPCYGQIGFRTHSVQCKFDSNRGGACKWTLKQDSWQMIFTFTQIM